MDERYDTFESVEERLRAIVDEVSREDISLDDALQLYEEAAKLTGVACTLSEQGIEALYPPEEPETDEEVEGAAVEEAVVVAEAPVEDAAVTEVAEVTEVADAVAEPAADEGSSAF